MHFDSNKSLYSDTLLPDIFVTEYMPSMDGDYTKVYVYCLFLSRYNKNASVEDLSKILGVTIDKVKDGLVYLENVGIIKRTDKGTTIIDLKDKEIKKIYRMKNTSTPEEAIQSSARNRRRNSAIASINNTFFQGLMSASWYTDIDAWFDRYKFDEDIMVQLFQHCFDHKGLSKQYIGKVADNWHSKGIKNVIDLENYMVEYQKLRDIQNKIVKKLKRRDPLTEYEEEYVEKWVIEYKYDFAIIDVALKKTAAKASANFKYIHAIISDWYKNGLKSKDEIDAFEANKKQLYDSKQVKETVIPQRGNFDQRKYDDSYYDNLYKNVRK